MNRLWQAVGAVAGTICLAAVVSACGGGSSSDVAKTTSTGSKSTTTTGGNSASQKSSGGCANIKQADVQALLPSPITSVQDTGIIGNCIYKEQGGGSLEVTLYPSDPDSQYYKTLSMGTKDHQLSGVGEEAYWNEAIPGQSPPELIAHGKNRTCVIQSNDPPDTTLKNATISQQTGLPTFGDQESADYAVLMGKVCADYLNGS